MDLMARRRALMSAQGSAPSGGLTLLGSGTYNKDNDSASISIPVTYTGTPRLFYAVNTTPKAETAQTIMFGRWMAFDDPDAESVEPVGGLWMAKGINATGTMVVAVARGVIPQLSSNTMSSNRPAAGFTHCAGAWKWYIYGEA